MKVGGVVVREHGEGSERGEEKRGRREGETALKYSNYSSSFYSAHIQVCAGNNS